MGGAVLRKCSGSRESLPEIPAVQTADLENA